MWGQYLGMADRVDGMFRVQAAFSFTALVFCVAMLAAGHETSYYLPVLTSIVGYWLPAPTFRGRAPNLFLKRDPSTPGDVSPESPTEVPAVLDLADIEQPVVLVLTPEAKPQTVADDDLASADPDPSTRSEPPPKPHEELISVVIRDS